MLDERKKLVLRAIIHDYIHTAEPVGSRTIARKYQLGVSPATIRNEMADLEETGYLQQPHISAGRIPSDKGYRFYVDMLMEPEDLPEEESQRVQDQVFTNYREMERLIQETSRVLAFLTHSISVVLVPPTERCTLKHLQLVPLDPRRILLILVLAPSMVQNRVIAADQPYEPATLERLSQLLNQRLRGLTYRELGASLQHEIVDDFGEIGRVLLDAVAGELAQNREEQVYLNGVLHLFHQPEFHDVERARTLLTTLEDKGQVTRILSHLSSREGVQVSIGRENRVMGVHECSLVTATYRVGGEVIGTIGVIGPTRMHYDRMYSVVDYVSSSLSEVLTEIVK